MTDLLKIADSLSAAGLDHPAVDDAVIKLTNAARGVVDDWTPAGNGDYDRSIHANPSAEAWADLFVATFPGLADKHDLMRGWFANAMMAMHDHLHHKLQAAQPAVPSVPDGESVTLTVAQIADLARFAGLTLAQSPQPDPDELEATITVCECPEAGVLLDGEDADPGVAAHYTHIAYYSEYPDEGCIGLGPEIAATPKDQPAQGEG